MLYDQLAGAGGQAGNTPGPTHPNSSNPYQSLLQRRLRWRRPRRLLPWGNWWNPTARQNQAQPASQSEPAWGLEPWAQALVNAAAETNTATPEVATPAAESSTAASWANPTLLRVPFFRQPQNPALGAFLRRLLGLE